MAVLKCSGWRCQRMISISWIPGWNPVARGDVEHFATSFVECSDCGRPFCDRCFTPRRLGRPTCRGCGGPLRKGDPGRPRQDRLPDAAFLPFERGVELAGQGQHAAALDAFDGALRVRPGYIDARLRRGESLLALGRLNEAISAFNEVTRWMDRGPWPSSSWRSP